MVETFRAGSSNSVVLRAARRPASLASAIGRGLSDLGAALGGAADNQMRVQEANLEADARIDEIERQRTRARRAVEFGGKLADARLKYVTLSQEARGETAPGAPGWAEKATEIREEVFGGLLEDYSDDPELAVDLGRSIQSVTASIAERELGWELEQRSEWEAESYSKAAQVEADALVDDPAQLPEALARMNLLLDATDHDGNTKAKVADATRAQLANSAFEGMERRGGFDQIEALLNSGAFDGALGKDGKTLWLDRIEAGRAQVARAQEAAALEVQKAAIEDAETVRAQADAGEDVPASRFIEVAARMRAANVPEADVIEFLALGTQQVRVQAARSMQTPQLEGQIGSLRAKVNSGEGSGQDAKLLDVLEKELDRRDDDAASLLSGLESDDVGERSAAIAQLAQMTPQRRFAAASKAGDTSAAFIAELPARNQALAVKGRQVRANNPDAFMPANSSGKSDKALLDAEFRSILGPQITAQLIQTNMYEPLREAATDYFVGNQAQQGGAGQWGKAAFARSVSIMLGARQRSNGAYAGGLGTVRGHRVLLPKGVRTEEFDAEYSAMMFSGAVYGDNSPVKKDDVLRYYRPVYFYTDGKGAAYYQLHDRTGKPLLWKDTAEPYTFPVSAR